MSTHARVVQLIEPDPDPNLSTDVANHDLSIEEGAAYPLVEGQTEYDIVFQQAKLNADYDFVESDVVSTDADPLSIMPTMSNRTVDGFTLNLDALPDSGNYKFNWRVRVAAV